MCVCVWSCHFVSASVLTLTHGFIGRGAIRRMWVTPFVPLAAMVGPVVIPTVTVIVLGEAFLGSGPYESPENK